MQEQAPDRATATRMTESIVADAAKTDPNDVL
jgi:homoserine O-acetyltransferase